MNVWEASEMRQKVPSVTNLPKSASDERRVRMIKYTIAMIIRVICIVLMLFVQGWWLLLCAIGAIFLPYFAVIIANVALSPDSDEVVRPGPLLLVPPTSSKVTDQSSSSHEQ
jgi:amino acid transporter